jgi:hypothetical protein
MLRCLVWLSFLVPVAAQATPAAFHDLTIVYASDRRGEVAPCHCDSAPLGGVDRQAGYVEALRKEGRNLLLLDGGDNFFPEPSAMELGRYLPRAELIADAFAMLKPAAVVPGERDLAGGISLWKTLGVRARVTWLISNLAPTSGKTVHFNAASSRRTERATRAGAWLRCATVASRVAAQGRLQGGGRCSSRAKVGCAVQGRGGPSRHHRAYRWAKRGEHRRENRTPGSYS